MIDLATVFILAQKELRDARRNRWFLLYAVAFAGLSLGLAALALSGAGNYGLAGFGRTSASLINLILLIVPLMGLTLGALSLAGEREKGTLLYLLAQPITQVELLLGKFIGLALALMAAIALGFGLTGLLIGVNGGGAQVTTYLGLLLLTCLLVLVSLSAPRLFAVGFGAAGGNGRWAGTFPLAGVNHLWRFGADGDGVDPAAGCGATVCPGADQSIAVV